MTGSQSIPLLLAMLSLSGFACIVIGMRLPDDNHLVAAGCVIIFAVVAMSIYAIHRSEAEVDVRGLGKTYGRATQ